MSQAIKGVLAPPADKSITHRAILLSTIFKGRMHLVDPLMSDDTQSSLDCVRKLGVCVLEQSLDNKMIVLQGALGRFLQGGYALDFDCGN